MPQKVCFYILSFAENAAQHQSVIILIIVLQNNYYYKASRYIARKRDAKRSTLYMAHI